MNAVVPVRGTQVPRARHAWLAVMLVTSLSALAAHAAGPEKTAAVDLGPLAEQPGAAQMSVTVALRMQDAGSAESLMASVHTPGDPQYRHFLTAAQFEARFAPSAADVTKVTTALARYGLTAERASALTLRVTGSPAAMEHAFGVNLHAYQVPARGDEPAHSFHAPLSPAVIPPEVAGSVSGVAGLDSRPKLRPHLRQSVSAAAAGASPSSTNRLQHTVTDFAQIYDVQPLYKQGVTGKGRTIGIVTLANFTPSDVFAYWSAVGLKVDEDRLKIVDIDGGLEVPPSDSAGSLESTLDVEQSGGLAPGARIIVYLAPNTNQAFFDAFVRAVEDNRAQSVSTSWGLWEYFQSVDFSPVTDPTGQTTGFYQALHEQLVRAALQGQSMFSASGDGGAYDVNGDFGCFPPVVNGANGTYSCSLALTVDYPSSDTAITAGGGTTLPGVQKHCSACKPPIVLNIKNEQVWGWDYLIPVCAAEGFDPISCGIFPGGTGGGVSFFFARPLYQDSLQGMRRTEEDQVWQPSDILAGAIGIPTTPVVIPEEYRGRNVPDVSFNGDPETGYLVAYTSSNPTVGFSFQEGWGGTSFVAPQLNGLTALFGQRHGRLGLLNYSLYQLAHNHQAYGGKNPPLRAIKDGDNWFYRGSNGYNPATGLGVMDVANFDATLPGHQGEDD